jgi:HAD superfamily hydrolase (TIGR01509 family)
MGPNIVLLDDGGVMNDNELRQEQWYRLVGEFFVPILGGTHTAWADANRVVIKRLLEPATWAALLAAATDYASFERMYYRVWLGDMCALAGVPAPPETQRFELAAAADDFITRRVHSAYPGVVEAIRALRAQGYELHTASGESSATLAGYLDGMGIRDCFGRLYGPDLIDTFKDGPSYYERLIADLGVPPGNTLVVDDNPRALSWAAQAGAHTVLVGSKPAANGVRQICSLAELPQIIHTIGGP